MAGRHGAHTPNTPTAGVDLIVSDLKWSLNGGGFGTASPTVSDLVVFQATVTNNGTSATPASTILDITFYIDGPTTTWSDNTTASLGAGAARVQTANGGPSSVNYWTATSGAHTLTAIVNQGNPPSRLPITETNTANNSTATTITVITGGGGGGGGSEPSLPSNATVGQPAYKALYWGGATWIYDSGGVQYPVWHGRGVAAMGPKMGLGYGYGGSYNFQGSAVGTRSFGDPLWMQSIMEGSSGFVAQANSSSIRCNYGFYFHDAPPDNPAYGDYWDDTVWAAVATFWGRMAAACEFMDNDGMVTDTELNTTGWGLTTYTGNTHTAAQNQAKLFQRGQEVGAAIWGAKPDMNLYWYSNYPHYGFQSKIQEIVNAIPPATGVDLQVDLLHGFLDAMRTTNATGAIYIVDASFFRFATNPLPSATDRAAYQLNNFGARAYYSSRFNQNVWDYACKGDGHLFICGFNWLGRESDDPAQYYTVTELSPASWALTRGYNRLYSEGLWTVEYNGPQDDNPWNNAKYSTSDAIAGAIAAASPTAISTSLPTITSLVASAAGDTITCVCTHVYGIYSVKVYAGSTFSAGNPEASYLGAGKLVWSENGGSYTSHYDASFQTATYSTTVSSGDWFAVKVTSAKGDYRWQTVQAP